LPLRALFYGLMLASGNDAANVIAQHVSGSIPAFMEELNGFLREKGCLKTVFHTPHGMPHEEHKTTAYDMALIAREALKHPFFCEVVGSMTYPRPQTNKQPESLMLQHNALLKKGPFYYPKAFGIKTGYSISSGYTLVASARDKGRTVIAVVLGCEKLEQRYRDAIALFEAAFAEALCSRKLFARGFEQFSVPVKGGKTPLKAHFAEDLVVEYYPSEEPQFKTVVQWALPALPIAQGQKVGEVQVVSLQGNVLKSAPLFACHAVESTLAHQCRVLCGQVRGAISRQMALVLALMGLLVMGGGFYTARR
jgi:D-alanyl-D-alanine carboxypeptidase (penicillin-binding protein 5/6)